jgi:hypothetical protein
VRALDLDEINQELFTAGPGCIAADASRRSDAECGDRTSPGNAGEAIALPVPQAVIEVIH